MRSRQQSGSTTELLTVAPVARVFTPADLDIDDLAEAIRLLLGPDDAPRIQLPDQANSNLLSFALRGTHVMEADEAQ